MQLQLLDFVSFIYHVVSRQQMRGSCVEESKSNPGASPGLGFDAEIFKVPVELSVVQPTQGVSSGCQLMLPCVAVVAVWDTWCLLLFSTKGLELLEMLSMGDPSQFVEKPLSRIPVVGLVGVLCNSWELSR